MFKNSESFIILIANRIFHVTVLLRVYFCKFATNLWHQKFVTADVTAVFVNNQRGIQRRGQDFHKKFVFEGIYAAERLTKECPEKNCTKHGAGKLLRKLRPFAGHRYS